MSRPSGVPVPQEHPDHDLLADLAAEVLPPDLAQRVQDHVIECPYCAAVLAEAEGIRSLLLQSEPEAMPAEVWSRLERALVTARRDDQVSATGPLDATAAISGLATGPNTTSRVPADGITGSIGITGYMGATGTMGAVGSGSSDRGGRRIARSGPPPPTTSIGLAGAASNGPPTSRLNRMSRPTQRARRQAIEEQKADRTPLLARFGRVGGIAAGVIVLLGVGALAIHLTQGGGGTADSASGSSGTAFHAGTPALVPAVQETNTNYTRAQLQGQIQTLVASSLKITDSTAASDAAGPSASAAVPKAATAAGVEQGQQLRSPAALQGCLKAIGAQQQPVAIDLARYAGQEAAIIVLPADGGGYEVEVVARDCRPGNDGTIDVVTLKSP